MFFGHLTAPFLLTGVAWSAPTATKKRQLCSTFQHVHLPGTGESGFGAVGTPLAQALEKVIPGTTSYAIPYDTRMEYVETVSEGARITEEYLAAQSACCPDQRFILSGYSKGVWVTHETNLNSDLKSKVLTVLAFGDPYRKVGQANSWPINSPSVNSKPREGSTNAQNVVSFCNSGDEFCDPAGVELTPHLAYSYDGSVDIATDFAKARA